MDYNNKYLKYKIKYLKLKSQQGGLNVIGAIPYAIPKHLIKAIASGTQIITEKARNEVNCVTNDKNRVNIINKINECRTEIINILTKEFYAQIIRVEMGFDSHKKNFAYTDVRHYKRILRLIIEVVNTVEREGGLKTFMKSFTSYKGYYILSNLYEILNNVEKFKSLNINKNILTNSKQIKNNIEYILNNIQCMFRGQSIPLYGVIKSIETNNKTDEKDDTDNKPPIEDYDIPYDYRDMDDDYR